MKITMIGECVTVILNGEVVVDHAPLENFFANQKSGYVAYAQDSKSSHVEGAKQPNGFMLDPAFPKGPIQLQTHGSEIRWRSIFIREISSEESNRHLAERNSEGFIEWNNGKDLSNWQGAVESYEVQQGVIVCKPKGRGDLLTKEEFENFLIRTEFMLPLGGNNGIAIRNPIDGHSSRDGLEIQVLDSDGYNASHPEAPLKPYQYHGSIYNCVGAKHGYLRPVGEWNFQEIEVVGQRVRVTLNGTKILDVDLDRLDRSQIETPPKGLDRRKGFVGFAGHYDPVAYRSFKVKKL